MQELLAAVYRVQPDKITATKYSSFFVQHRGGNLLFPCFAKGGNIDGSFEQLERLGGLERQVLCDMHFKGRQCDTVYERFSAPTYCSDIEAADVSRSVEVVKTFPFRRHALRTGVEVVPTPGHRPGACCYLVKLGAVTVLFAGDNLWYDGKAWTALPAKGGTADMLQSLDALANCEFTTLFVNSLATEKVCSITLRSAKERTAFFAAVGDRIGC
jgi:hydroxyacylglutathione hydrolase